MIQHLIKLCIQKDKKAQRELYDMFADKLFAVGFRYLKSTAESEDVVINSFLKIFDHLTTFEYKTDSGLYSWMKKILINECLMVLRKKKQLNFASEDYFEGQETSVMPLSDLEEEDIFNMILSLPNGYRIVFNLFAIEGFTHKEIAERLNITEATSKSQLFKAKKTLQNLLVKQGISYGR